MSRSGRPPAPIRAGAGLQGLAQGVRRVPACRRGSGHPHPGTRHPSQFLTVGRAYIKTLARCVWCWAGVTPPTPARLWAWAWCKRTGFPTQALNGQTSCWTVSFSTCKSEPLFPLGAGRWPAKTSVSVQGPDSKGGSGEVHGPSPRVPAGGFRFAPPTLPGPDWISFPGTWRSVLAFGARCQSQTASAVCVRDLSVRLLCSLGLHALSTSALAEAFVDRLTS